jgi:hypothetical protein
MAGRFTLIEVNENEYTEARRREGRASKYAEIDEMVSEMTDGTLAGILISDLLDEFGEDLDVVKQVKAHIGKLGQREYGIGRVYRFAEDSVKLMVYKTTEAQREELRKKADANIS